MAPHFSEPFQFKTSQRKELEKKLEAVPDPDRREWLIRHIEERAGWYKALKRETAADGETSAKDAGRILERMESHAAALGNLLEDIPTAVESRLLDAARHRFRKAEWLETLVVIRRSCAAAAGARREPGAPPKSDRVDLIFQVAKGCRRVGMQTTKTASGEFYKLMAFVLEAVGEHQQFDPALKAAVRRLKGQG